MAGLQCYIGNCSSMEACRRPELVTDCPHDQAYDACLSIIVQKGRLLTKWSKIFIYSNEVSLFFSQRNWQFTHKMLYQPPPAQPGSACIKFADRIIVNLVIVEIFPESDLSSPGIVCTGIRSQLPQDCCRCLGTGGYFNHLPPTFILGSIAQESREGKPP